MLHGDPKAATLMDEESIVIDDNASMREALHGLFRSVGQNARSFASTEKFLAGERLNIPACLVLDVRMRGESGLDFQGELVKQHIAVPMQRPLVD